MCDCPHSWVFRLHSMHGWYNTHINLYHTWLNSTTPSLTCWSYACSRFLHERRSLWVRLQLSPDIEQSHHYPTSRSITATSDNEVTFTTCIKALKMRDNYIAIQDQFFQVVSQRIFEILNAIILNFCVHTLMYTCTHLNTVCTHRYCPCMWKSLFVCIP